MYLSLLLGIALIVSPGSLCALAFHENCTLIRQFPQIAVQSLVFILLYSTSQITFLPTIGTLCCCFFPLSEWKLVFSHNLPRQSTGRFIMRWLTLLRKRFQWTTYRQIDCLHTTGLPKLKLACSLIFSRGKTNLKFGCFTHVRRLCSSYGRILPDCPMQCYRQCNHQANGVGVCVCAWGAN